MFLLTGDAGRFCARSSCAGLTNSSPPLAPAMSSGSVLASSHGGSHVSQSGLSKILKEVRDKGLPKALSRSAVKRARDSALPRDIFTDVLMQMTLGTHTSIPL